MKVYLVPNGLPWTSAPVLTDLAALSRRHRLVEDPDDAELAIYADSHIGDRWNSRRTLMEKAIARRLLERGVLAVYDERDLPRPDIPGGYTSLRGVAPPWATAICYLRPGSDLEAQPRTQAQHLFAFLGARTHEVRARMTAIDHPRGLVRVLGPEVMKPLPDQAFVEHLRSTKFVLCPRGHGPSSFRIFEALASARVPVVISDDWVPPVGPDWSRISIRVRERDVLRTPSLLESRESEFEPMAAAARLAFEEHFSRGVLFDRLVDRLAEVVRLGPSTRQAIRYLAPYDIRRGARVLRHRVLR